MAGGFAFNPKKTSFDLIKQQINETVSEMVGEVELKPQINIDLALEPNDITLDLIEELNLQIIHQTGLKNYESYMDSISSELRNNKAYLPLAYLENMALYLSCADLVIARAGSLSLSEFNLCGLPSLLIPYPHAANNHQYHNAMVLVNHDAASIIEERLSKNTKKKNTKTETAK